MNRRGFVLTAAVLLASGCGTFGPAFQPHPAPKSDQALLYIYRPEARALSILTAEFAIDGSLAARLENNGYVAVVTSPGKHSLRQKWKAGLLGRADLERESIDMELVLLPGSTTFVRLGAAADSQYQSGVVSTNWRWELRRVPEAVATQELAVARRGEVVAPAR